MVKKLLIIGPIPPPIHGESMALNSVLKSKLINKAMLIEVLNTSKNDFQSAGKISVKRLYIDGMNILKLAKWTFRNQKQIVYLSISQTKLGLIRDSIFILVAKLNKNKVITHLHGNNLGNTIDSLSPFIKKVLIKKAFKKINCGIILGRGLEDNYKGLIENIKIVPNGINENFITNTEYKNKKKEEGYLNIIYLSNLMKDKGYKLLIDCTIELLKNNYKINLKLAGAVEDKNEFEELMAKVQLEGYENFITYKGIVADEEKKKLLLASDIMILPTTYKIEGQPLSIIEGMSAGLPIISSERGVIPDLIQNNGILLSETPTLDELKVAIEQLYNNKEYMEELSLNSRKRFISNYTEMHYHNELLTIFNDND
ncbi:glycosyltransferase family 4 protein [Niallia circulans]|uniref:glycosyltransferase family 4 protein n=1 Tax=Niallia circulans TaxID=1397 RepID=UPI002E2072E2|nr:glycosyltransferase family 4 protein [Niallia circulans]